MDIFLKVFFKSVTFRVFIINILAVIVISFINVTYVLSQQPKENVDKFNIRNFNEEIYVLTDRDIYITGEQVWLKVYKMNGLAHIPWDMSKVVYLELLDKNNFPVRQLKVMIEGKSGSSNFTLPDNISSGNYIIRAYTLWMQNFSTDLFFYKTISVINPFESIEHLPLPSKKRIPDSIIIFPEGGSLIGGHTNKIGIRSYDKDGGPAAMQGVIIKNYRDTICRAVTKENGFGIFELNPGKSDTYSLLYRAENGKNNEVPLPEIMDPGIGLRVDHERDNKSFIVKILKDSEISFKNVKLNFVVYNAGAISFLKELKIDRDSVITLSPDEFPCGMSQFLLINEKGTQLAGRYVFKDCDDRINLKLTLQKPEYFSREKVKINIFATDMSGQPIETDLSVSVTKSVVANLKVNMYRNFYGSINYDWNEINNKSADTINDYLILYPANGFNWMNFINPEKMIFKFLPEMEGHQIRGNMRLKSTHEPLKETDISLSYVGKTARCQFGKTDENGEFNFVIRESGLSEIVIQPLSPEVKGYYTEIDQPFCDTYSSFKPPSFYLDSNRLSSINNVIISMQINNIYEPFRENKPKIEIINSPDFYGKPENTIKMSDYIALTTLREVVKEILPNVYTVKQNGKYDFKLINKYRGQPFTNIPLILVDGVPIYDVEKVLSISSKDIERADILNARYFFSENVFDGIVSFISKKGDLNVIDFDISIFRQVYEACQIPNSFYSPDYSTDLLKNSRIPDFRNTLFWGPDLQTGKDGKTEFEFYSSDESAEYVISVEGISSDGKKGTTSMPLIIKTR
jgi:hypothetical protein